MTESLIIATEDGEVPHSAEDKAKQLPAPVGYKILVALPEVEDKYESGLVKAGSTVHYEEVLSTVFFVVALGPDCYTDKTRYPTGPWCKPGDFVVLRSNSGSRLKIHGKEFRMINEDTVDAVVQDPRGISRA